MTSVYSKPSVKTTSKVIVIGSGVGGLTCAALLAQDGYDVTVLEAQTYPGGCASTWAHKGFRFESGATVAGGFHANGPHKVAGDALGIQWPVRRHDTAWVVHLPGCDVPLNPDNAEVVAAFPQSAVFWEQQRKVADLTWRLAAEALPWPPTSAAEVWRLGQIALKYFPADLKLLPYAFMTVLDWVKSLGLADDKAFRRFLDGQLLISAQSTAEHVNALWGATALDLARQGVYHVRGGIGGLAQTLADSLREKGGKILYRHRASRLEISNGEVVGVWAKRGRVAQEAVFFPADFVVANTTPWDVDALLDNNSPRRLKRELAGRKPGWGAFVLHLGMREEVFPEGFPEHHQLLLDIEGPLGETRSIFMSISPEWDDSRAPMGQRAVTITTHTDPQQWWDALELGRDAYYVLKEEFSRKIICALNRLIPGFSDAITLTLPGTPVTYQYYTDRHHGMVGGFPMTSLFKARGPRTGICNLRLVGDSIFPGQSTAGVTIGAIRVAADVRRNLAKTSTRSLPSPVALTTDEQELLEEELA